MPSSIGSWIRNLARGTIHPHPEGWGLLYPLTPRVKWLRGDAISEAIDIYFHISPKDVEKEYLTHVPQLGI
jgi:hypothetical protein